MEITAQQVKELRDRTGIGMMECKEALQESGGDIEKLSKFCERKAMLGPRKKLSARLPMGHRSLYSCQQQTWCSD